jgi:hypothetical protein
VVVAGFKVAAGVEEGAPASRSPKRWAASRRRRPVQV